MINLKHTSVNTIIEASKNATAVFLADFTGVTSNQMNSIRAQARDNNISTKVVKHTLTKIGLKNTHFECIGSVLEQKKVLLFVYEDISDAAKTLNKIIDRNDKFLITHICFKDTLYTRDMFQTLLLLPTRQEALQKLVQTCIRPIHGLISVLEQAPRSLITSLTSLQTIKSQE